METEKSTHNYRTLHATVKALPLQGKTLLDLGAGAGIQAREYADLGANVIAVDRNEAPPDLSLKGIVWITADVHDFVRVHKPSRYDLVLCINLIQFLSETFIREELMPYLAANVSPNGTCAIRTFQGQPEPPMIGKFSTFWQSAQLAEMMNDFDVTAQADYGRMGHDFAKNERYFRLAEFIGKRK